MGAGPYLQNRQHPNITYNIPHWNLYLLPCWLFLFILLLIHGRVVSIHIIYLYDNDNILLTLVQLLVTSLFINPYATTTPSPHNATTRTSGLCKSHLPFARIKGATMYEGSSSGTEEEGGDMLATMCGGDKEAGDA